MQCPCGGFAPSRYHVRVDGTKVVTWECRGCGRVKIEERRPEKKPVPTQEGLF